MRHSTVLIVGAGPAGLAMGGRLRRMGIPFEMLEQSEQIAHAWQQHYDRLHLHTIKEFSALPHQPFPADFPRYIPRRKLVGYYENYAREMRLEPHFGEEVVHVRREGQHWRIATRRGTEFEAQGVVVCTGFNRVVNRPKYAGESEFGGKVLHSREYKNPQPFLGQKVLVVGMGNTGAEIALDLYEQGSGSNAIRQGPVNIVPRDFNGRPTQQTAKLLNKLPTSIGDWIGVQVQKLAIGDLTPYGIQRPDLPPAKQLRVKGKTPVIDIGTVAQIKAGKIAVKPGIDRYTPKGVRFADGSSDSFDAVILATGYHSRVQDFVEQAEGLLNEHGHPASSIAPPSHPQLYFLGFDAYSTGILESIYKESARIAADIYRWAGNDP